MIKRREFITLLGGAVSWPLAARAQQPAMPVVGFVSSRSLDGSARHAAAFTKGLSEPGYVEGQNVVVEYHWLSGQNDRLPALMADLVRRRVAVIATLGDPSTLAAKAATERSRSPLASVETRSALARPGGNVTGINFFTSEVLAKRLGLLHELVPKAGRIVVLVNPTNAPSTESTLRDVPEAARAIGLQIQILNASTSSDRCHGGGTGRRRFASGRAKPDPRRAHGGSAGGRGPPACFRQAGRRPGCAQRSARLRSERQRIGVHGCY
jgi:putative tryptophan/tyrosine transport system substrate-binding protein